MAPSQGAYPHYVLGVLTLVYVLNFVDRQILSILNSATVVERSVLLTSVSVNGPDFDSRRERGIDRSAAHAAPPGSA